jgi:drug/metabolite transporter (DMT)-like permease
VVMSIAALTWFISIDLAVPSITAFVSQLGVVVGVGLGAVVLHERITWIDRIGGALAIMGALVISYRADSRVETGVLLVLVNCVGVAIQNLLVKKNVQRIDKLELIFVRSVIGATFIFAFAASTHTFAFPKTVLLPGFFFGSFFGYVAVNLLLYQALSHVDLTKVSILAVTGAPMVMVGSIIAFRDIPTTLQLAGCALILAGVALIVAKPVLALRHAPVPTEHPV